MTDEELNEIESRANAATMGPWKMDEQYRCYCGDWAYVMPLLPDASVDAVITDPPYGYGLDIWDTPIDMQAFSREVTRVVHPDGLYAVFGQMPTLFAWYDAAVQAGMAFLECIVWVKRIVTPGYRLSRGYEHILLFAVGKRRKLHQTRGPYEDVKLPGVLVDIVTLEGIDRHIKDLRNGGGQSCRLPRNGDIYERFDVCSSRRSPAQANYTNVWSFLSPNQAKRRKTPKDHPTEKPLPIMERLVEMCSLPGQLVLDPFMGSGTTGAAALRLGRRFVGGEKHFPYLVEAQRRLREEMQHDAEQQNAHRQVELPF